jgi:hypothetical protein
MENLPNYLKTVAITILAFSSVFIILLGLTSLSPNMCLHDYDFSTKVVLDNNGDIIIFGTTNSIDFPSTFPVDYEYLKKGSFFTDWPFITKFNEHGELLWSRLLNVTIVYPNTIDGTIDNEDNIYCIIPHISTYDEYHPSIIKFSPQGIFIWEKTFTDLIFQVGPESKSCITFDSENDMYVAGTTLLNVLPDQTGYFDYDPLSVNKSQSNIILTKFSSNGTRLLTVLFGGESSEKCFEINIDLNRSIIVTGQSRSSNLPKMYFEGDIRRLEGDRGHIFISKILTNGTYLWTRIVKVAADSFSPTAITTDNSNNIILAGRSVDFDTFDSSPFIYKLTPNGNISWNKHIEAMNYSNIQGITTDVHNNIVFTGLTELEITINGQAFNGSLKGDRSCFLGYLSPNGEELLYGNYMGGQGSDGGSSVVIDNTGNIIITGITTSTNFPLKNSYQSRIIGDTDIFIMKLDQMKTNLWSTLLGGSGKSH